MAPGGPHPLGHGRAADKVWTSETELVGTQPVERRKEAGLRRAGPETCRRWVHTSAWPRTHRSPPTCDVGIIVSRRRPDGERRMTTYTDARPTPWTEGSS